MSCLLRLAGGGDSLLPVQRLGGPLQTVLHQLPARGQHQALAPGRLLGGPGLPPGRPPSQVQDPGHEGRLLGEGQEGAK